MKELIAKLNSVTESIHDIQKIFRDRSELQDIYIQYSTYVDDSQMQMDVEYVKITFIDGTYKEYELGVNEDDMSLDMGIDYDHIEEALFDFMLTTCEDNETLTIGRDILNYNLPMYDDESGD